MKKNLTDQLVESFDNYATAVRETLTAISDDLAEGNLHHAGQRMAKLTQTQGAMSHRMSVAIKHISDEEASNQ